MTTSNVIDNSDLAVVTPRELEEQTRQVLQEIETSGINAFSWVQCTPAVFENEALAGELSERPLAGLPVAVKEVIDVAGAPIGRGCGAFAGRIADASAEIVLRLEALGAQIIGITRSTEMAIAGETSTLNPWSSQHSPGASSSGSAAAVGAGLVPFALGTQTIGSVIRPAAYCGVVGFKPSLGVGPTAGVALLSATLDHVGYFADSLERMRQVLSLLYPSLSPIQKADSRPRFVFVEPWFDCTGLGPFYARQHRLKSACEASGYDWAELTLDEEITGQEARLVHTILCFEMFRSWGSTLLHHPGASEELKGFLRHGKSITEDEYNACLNARLDMMERVAGQLDRGDIVVFPSVLGVPPKIGQGTGSRDPQRLWTLLGMPALNLPVGWGEGFPLNLQLVARRGEDRRLLEAAQIVSELMGQPIPDSVNG
ncbi:amidase [Marinobacter sp. F3R08]|uniref:amidase n=1 Tax=Marinobacter sp. F3R08 TaxID=2841559 RepID=UPI001C085043|nr:amidase [Marinobacter sp. F3R08]MBU2953914.1 amidase [Marinobacter sp. F3R08]